MTGSSVQSEKSLKNKGKIPVIIGVTGHRRMREQDLEKITESVREQISKLRRRCPHSQIKEALSVKINSTALITEMVFGDLSGADLVFTFRKPEDLTLQDRFLVEIMKNNPDRAIREHVRQELLWCNTSISGIDLTKPDPLFKEK